MESVADTPTLATATIAQSSTPAINGGTQSPASASAPVANAPAPATQADHTSPVVDATAHGPTPPLEPVLDPVLEVAAPAVEDAPIPTAQDVALATQIDFFEGHHLPAVDLLA
jgi:hypothetical protein